MKTHSPRLITRAFASLIAAAGVSFCIGGTVFLMSMPSSEYAAATEFVAQSTPLMLARKD